VWWCGGEEGEFLAELGPARFDERLEGVEVLHVWTVRGFHEFHGSVISGVVFEFENVH
jgi:hypothetical protein